MNKLTLFLLLIFVIQPLLADTSTPPVTLKYIETGWGGEAVFFGTVEDIIVEGCANPIIRVDSNHIIFNTIVSIGLSAYHADSKVIFRVAGCSGSGNAWMNAIAIKIVD